MAKNKNIYVNGISQLPTPMRKVEIVERKGIGHPDSVADALSETVSEALCKMYIKEFGHVLHHNTDETQIVAGMSHPQYGGGNIVNPSYILLVGRATTSVQDGKVLKELPCKPTALEAARKYMKKNFPNLNTDRDIILDVMLGMGSDDLKGVYNSSKFPSNDTSFGVGYAPFSVTDSLTLETERYINGALKKEMPCTGQDVKVMCSRIDQKITMTVACAMVDRYLEDQTAYESAVEELTSKVTDFGMGVIDRYGGKEKLKVDVNTGDDYRRGVTYLTVTGMSQEMGDDGSVGRGNRANGLITPYRPMSMEATSGKNPITHVGKLYNVLSNLIAKDVAAKVGADAEIHVRLLSQIGHPISDPLNASVDIILPNGAEDPKLPKWKSEAEQITADWLDNIDKVTDLIINGKVNTF
ncbi:MAG: methionine adenosyltransferase [Methanomethylophilus sp.]